MKSKKGIIFDIQRFSVHDGPGIRTNIFLKGCPLRCDWCCNPESQRTYPHPMYTPEKCIGCGACIAVCPKDAITRDDRYRIDIHRCRECPDHPCVKECYARALSLAGKEYSPQEVLDIIERDRMFYQSSHGGVTFTGGEAVMQIDFLEEALRLCREHGIDTAMETCSACAWEDIQRTVPYVNTYLCDVKHVDPVKYRQETGGNCETALQNIRALEEAGANIIARIPVIPGFNETEEEIRAIGGYLCGTGIKRVDLLPYHRLGEPKYEKIFSRKKPQERRKLSREELNRLQQILREMGLDAAIG